MRFFTLILIALSVHIGPIFGLNKCGPAASRSRAASLLGESGKKILLDDITRAGAGNSLVDWAEIILFDVIPVLIGQKPFNLDGKFQENREYFFEDTSNDELFHFKLDEIIKRSGYRVETHTVVADDGYITKLSRIINPLADQTKLKQPPVMLMHGGSINPATYVWASAIQHHPEKYPRLPEDGPITSWNRSLAFMLANNGYDVWLVGTRGSTVENQGRLDMMAMNTIMPDGNRDKNMTSGEILLPLTNGFNYWRFSMDEIIQHEFPKQVEKILEITRAKNVSLFTYSLSTIIAFSALGARPDVAKKIHSMVKLAPILNLDGSSPLVRLGCEVIVLIPVDLGTILVTKLLLSPLMRNLMAASYESRELRYLVCKFFTNISLGSSGKYRTLLEPAVLGNTLQQASFKEIQHACQIVIAKRFQKYDFGRLKNKLIYGQWKPPAYNVSNIHVKNWMLIWGENDNFTPPSAIKQIVKEVNPKPLVARMAPGMNHLDLSAGFDNDIEVNLPTLGFLDRFRL